MRALLLPLLAAALLPMAAADAHLGADEQLISRCAARTDARMDSMTLAKLEQIRNFEFALRMAMVGAHTAPEPGPDPSVQQPAQEQAQAQATLARARVLYAEVCDLGAPAPG
jgi:hypothetical protein